MTREMTATQLKAHLLGVLDDVADGEVIEITKHGRTVARLVPAAGAHQLRGVLAGVAVTSASDEELFTTASPWNLG